MNSRIVLSHPFSGALLAFFAEALGARHVEAMPYHSYYRTLYGDRYQEWRDLAITLALMYHEVVIAPADNPMPDAMALGLSASWEEYTQIVPSLAERVTADLADPDIQRILHKVPRHAREQILRDARYEVYLAQKHECPIIAAEGRRRIISALLRRDAGSEGIRLEEVRAVRTLEEYVKVSGLLFNPSSLDALYSLKRDPSVRSYAVSFTSALHRLEGGTDLRTAMRTAAENAEAAAGIAGIFHTTGIVFNLLGVIPVVGPFFSVGSALAATAESLAERQRRKHTWYEFGPEIQRHMGREAIRRYLASSSEPKY